MIPDDGDPRHGTWNGYINLGCRCAACKEANAKAQADYIAAHPEQQDKKRERMRQLRAERREMSEVSESVAISKIAAEAEKRRLWVERENARKRDWRAKRKATAGK